MQEGSADASAVLAFCGGGRVARLEARYRAK
jgi:hypothetical protein